MKTIIAGSRSARKLDVYLAIKSCPWKVTSTVSGKCKQGADYWGEYYANLAGFDIDPYPVTPEDWDKYGSYAGPRRNKIMAQNAEALIAVWDGESDGTRSMIEFAEELGLKVHVYTFGKENNDSTS